jgi:eukaryotic-like serine/threonine-protein kinase
VGEDAFSRLSAALTGRYAIERELGQGGMATVYLAEDLKHDRRVAIKVLKPELAAVLGGDRFVVEIKTTASLQHPHILPLFDSGTADGFLFYVMPYVEGETIRGRLNRETQLGVEEAVRIAREIADALDYAHRHGVIHRDIKPENILLHDGRAMVMDFGIALAVSAAAGGRMTETGLSLGTPHYMSPEQATAEKEISGRSDVYSLASVLYEMLTGQPPHLGGSAQQIIMKIITEPALPMTALRKSVPPHVTAAVAVALEKLPADRFDSARSFAEALANPAFGAMSGTVPAAATQADRRWRMRFIALAGASAVLLAGSPMAWQTAAPRERRTTRLDLSIGDPALSLSAGTDVVISPDGSMLALTGRSGEEWAIYLRRLDGDPDFRKVPGTEGAEGSPAFSPDSRWIAFRRRTDYRFMRVPIAGGPATPIAQGSRGAIAFAHWGAGDHLVYNGGTSSTEAGPVRVSVSDGSADTLGLRGANRVTFLLPDGSGLLYTRDRALHVHTFRTDSSTQLLPFGSHAAYVATGHLLYVGETGGLFAVPFDLKRHRIGGAAVSVLQRVASTEAGRGYSVSDDGVLVYHDGPGTNSVQGVLATNLLIMAPGGAAEPLRLPSGRRLNPRFSPDGRSIAYEFFSDRGSDTDLYTFDLVTGTNTRLTFGDDNDDPVWSPDGRRIAFTKSGPGTAGEDIYVKQADNSGTEQLVLAQPASQNPLVWTRGDTILYSTNHAGQSDLFMMPLADSSQRRAYLEAPWREAQIRLSPDEKLAAFSSAEAGGSDVWIRNFPVAQGKWQVSSNGSSSSPRWSPDGQHVYFWRTGPAFVDTLFRARIDRMPSVRVRDPEVVLALEIGNSENWDLHPDGRRIIVAVTDNRAAPAAPSSRSRYLVVHNWFRELRMHMGQGDRR